MCAMPFYGANVIPLEAQAFEWPRFFRELWTKRAQQDVYFLCGELLAQVRIEGATRTHPDTYAAFSCRVLKVNGTAVVCEEERTEGKEPPTPEEQLAVLTRALARADIHAMPIPVSEKFAIGHAHLRRDIASTRERAALGLPQRKVLPEAQHTETV